MCHLLGLPMHVSPYRVTVWCYFMLLPYDITLWCYLHDKGFYMNSLCCAHAVGSGSHLRLQAGISQGLHQEHPAHKAEVQAHRACLIHQQHAHTCLVLQQHAEVSSQKFTDGVVSPADDSISNAQLTKLRSSSCLILSGPLLGLLSSPHAVLNVYATLNCSCGKS